MKPKHPEVTAVVLNWNGRKLLEKSLPALGKQTYRPLQVLLVDNASTDDSLAYVKKNFPQTKVIRNPTNLGFAAGMNIGLRAAKGKYVISVTNDVALEPKVISEMVAAAEKDSRVGMAVPLLVRSSEPSVIDAAGVSVDRSGYGANVGGGEENRGQFGKKPVEIFGGYGGATLYRRQMLDEIGYFEEAFGAYLEDIDLAWRARAAGWKCMLVPQVRAFHAGSVSYGKTSYRATYLGHRNRLLFALSEFPLKLLVPMLAYYIIFEIPMSVWWLATANVARVKARIDAFLMLPWIISRRRKLGAGRKVPVAELEKWLLPAYGVRTIKGKLFKQKRS
jgi:GT2 family glycosyltransferase